MKSKELFEAGVYRQLLCHPTGTGKTCLFVNLPKHHGLDKKRTMVLVNSDVLAKQTAKQFAKWVPGARVGTEMAESYAQPFHNIVIGSVPTLGRSGSTRLRNFPPSQFGTIIVDEAHHSIASTWRNIFRHFGVEKRPAPGAKVPLLFGVTATAMRGDGVGLEHSYDKIVDDYSITEAIDDGWLSEIKSYLVHTDVDLDSVPLQNGDFVRNDLEAAVNVDPRNAQIVDNWFENASDRKTLVFGVNVAHCISLAALFRKRGAKFEAVWGSDPNRPAKLEAFEKGQLHGLVNCQLLIEGYDDRNIRAIYMARPTKSEARFIQMLGRGTRLQEGIENLHEARRLGLTLFKEDCYIYDVVDNTILHKDSLMTVPSLFGMGTRLDLGGESVTKAKKKMAKLKNLHPEVDFSQLLDINKIDTYLEEVHLFDNGVDAEVRKHARYEWVRSEHGGYDLEIEEDTSMTINPTLVGLWRIFGYAGRNSIAEQNIESLANAFYQAEQFIDLVVSDEKREEIKQRPAMTKQVAAKKRAERRVS
jgi:ATP-dependent helicase IRC3